MFLYDEGGVGFLSAMLALVKVLMPVVELKPASYGLNVLALALA